MKLNLTPKELLALHNLLLEKTNEKRVFNDSLVVSAKLDEEDKQIQQIYARVRSLIVTALSPQIPGPAKVFFEKEQEKIDQLFEADENSPFKKSSVPDFESPFQMPDHDDYVYPRKQHRNGNKHAGKR